MILSVVYLTLGLWLTSVAWVSVLHEGYEFKLFKFICWSPLLILGWPLFVGSVLLGGGHR